MCNLERNLKIAVPHDRTLRNPAERHLHARGLERDRLNPKDGAYTCDCEKYHVTLLYDLHFQKKKNLLRVFFIFMGPCIFRYTGGIYDQQDATNSHSLLLGMLYMFRAIIAHHQELGIVCAAVRCYKL
jgi:hypothetical protein